METAIGNTSCGNAVKKVVVLNGSPKKENSTTLTVTRAFIDGLSSVFPVDCEYINISDLNIKPCTGCLSCWGRTEGTCVIRDDDIAQVKSKILAADYIIESFPLYFFGMPGEFKVFTDRMLSMLNTYKGQPPASPRTSVHGLRNTHIGQKCVIITSCAYTDAEFVYDALLKQLDFILGSDNYTALLCPQLQTVVKLGSKPRLNKYLSKFTEAGKYFAQNGKLTEEQLNELAKPPFSEETYRVLLNKFWENQKNGIGQ